MTSFKVRLPRPDRYLTPNCVTGTTPNAVWAVLKAHIAQKKKAKRLAETVVLKLLNNKIFSPSEYVLKWYYYGAKTDADNCLASCKAYLDGCAAAMGCNDRDWECAGVRRVRDKALKDYIELVFYKDPVNNDLTLH